jgi:hypothetical protein
MASLLDTIKMNQDAAAQQATSAPRQASEINVQSQSQKLLQAKSGKAVAPGSTPRQSNVQEQQAQQNALLQGQALAQQIQLGQQAIQAQATQQAEAIKVQSQEQDFQAQKLETDYLRSEDAALDQYLQGQKKLDLSKDKAKFEQMGFQMRMADSKYIDTLTREAKRSQLDNEVKFKEEMARTVFAEELEMFHDNLDFRNSMFSDKQEFLEQMGQMDLDYALQMGAFANQQAAANSLFTGVGQISSGSIQAYGAYSNSQDKEKADEQSLMAESGDGWEE